VACEHTELSVQACDLTQAYAVLHTAEQGLLSPTTLYISAAWLVRRQGWLKGQ
jgi:hypothetical protein